MITMPVCENWKVFYGKLVNIKITIKKEFDAT